MSEKSLCVCSERKEGDFRLRFNKYEFFFRREEFLLRQLRLRYLLLIISMNHLRVRIFYCAGNFVLNILGFCCLTNVN